MRIRLHRARAVASAAVVLCAAAVAACPVAAHADVTSTVGWVRIAQLSPAMTPVDVYLSPTSGQNAQPVLPHATYGTFSPYEAVAPGDYTVAMRATGAPVTTDPVAGTQLTVTAGQSYTVTALGAGSVTKLSVQDDVTDTSPGQAALRVIEASQQYPSASVSIGTDTVAANLRAPAVAPYQAVAPGVSALLVTTGTATQTVSTNLAANSAYTVVILDGTQGSVRVLVLTDAAGISALPKGGVNTGFGGTASTDGNGEVHRESYAAPLAEALLVLSVLGGTAIASIRRRRRRTARFAAHVNDLMQPLGDTARLREADWLDYE